MRPLPERIGLSLLLPLAGRTSAWLRTAHMRFTPETPGTYSFFCHVDHHAAKGMTGTLIVVP